MLTRLRSESRAAQHPGRALWSLLAEHLDDSPTQCLTQLGHALRLATADMETLRRLQPDFSCLSYAEAARRLCLVARETSEVNAVNGKNAEEGGGSGTLVCLLADPFDLALQSWLETRLAGQGATAPRWLLVHPDDLTAYFSLLEEKLRAMDGALPAMAEDLSGQGGSGQDGNADDLSLSSIARDSSPVIRLVNSTVFDAMKAGASDIHLETAVGGLTVKYRIDGVLTQMAQVPGRETAEQVVSRIKVMAELDIAERRIPQDGRFKVSIRGREIDFRVSVMPSLFGEDVVIRILDKQSLTDQILGLRLDLLGFDAELLVRIRRLAKEPYGMMLVTGPTGSGKTTTLYGALTEINNGQDKIVTIEDPVEYQLPGILQIPVNEKKGLTFARGLRSILRHDPDKILVGEIRDPETAQIAIQSALTGHLVFTSVHANNVFDVLGRFLHMGVDTYSFVSALNGVLAQRLVRMVCPECAETFVPSAEELAEAGIAAERLAGKPLKRGRGCGHCRGTGYKGRKAIGELMRLNDELREMIVARAPIRTIKDAAQAHGTRFLREAAIDAALAGQTTLEEINRVTFAD
ncbi:MAG: type II/IV secretion system protein [Rhodocyclaceae bacterium]|nr:MAG: type II/IV secretion system protein [Rhodocyclaceae bacterium]